MRGREGKGPPSTDLLVCFPTRAHLSLMPKPVSSPARPHHRRRPSLLKSTTTNTTAARWARSKSNNNEADSEPTSPKVTCAGQIKVRSSKPNSCKNWQSVMEEIERMHNHKKRPPWAAALGFKKEAMQFLACLRNLRFDFRCFGSIPAAEISSDDDEEELDDDGDDNKGGAVFSKWFMILQEENSQLRKEEESVAAEAIVNEAAPPANALMLMRCRSAPAKSWLEEKEEEEREEEEEKGAEFCEFAVEIGKEDWIQERICRSRSWKR
ncbi:hypothetical protein SASPL_106457 [Salvia splendens]|uniref:Uncharacterized protein n=1 Tax=Salvia splendens TaxID=180675 RepID=A0A8X8YNN5_SALSN|nr:uncharacterized protein LOC121767839 [Salvia splendens]KAG6434814.1 hypothetical protein SASPL_106457 [Salvia splendens]